jgi:hypothetical protein
MQLRWRLTTANPERPAGEHRSLDLNRLMGRVVYDRQMLHDAAFRCPV